MYFKEKVSQNQMIWIIVALLLSTLPACAQTKEEVKKSSTKPKLEHYEIKVSDLPPPKLENNVNNGPSVIERPKDAQFILPDGFQVSVFAEGDLKRPRWMALAPNGDIFVSESEGNRISILRDKDSNGTVDERFIFVTDLQRPFGMAFWKDYLYVADTGSVLRFRYKPGQTKAEGKPEKIADLPMKGYREHWTRNLIFSPDGSKLYVTVGSESNVDVEPEPMRAAITQFNPDGTGKRIFASGLRNPIGLAFYPGTNRLWASVQERDRLGDNLVPDYVTEVKDGAFYGWPYSYMGQTEDPRRKGEKPDLVKKAIDPDVLIQAHSAILGLVFYEGKMFPSEYQGDAFAALRGSWNRTKRTGYKIIRIRFKDGRPVGGYDDFIKGWMLDEDSKEVWGRPVGLLVLKDGSMLITDDGAHKIWRVTYKK
jgi:glucose/arabinose dehydrogenase